MHIALWTCLTIGAAPFPGDVEGVALEMGLDEPSGVAIHPGTGRVWAVSDTGQVASTTLDGDDPELWAVDGDLEAVCAAGADVPFVYVGQEHPDAILELDPTTGEVTRTFALTDWMDGPDNDGLEALTFVPDPIHPEGGVFYAGHQGEGAVYRFDLPIRTSSDATDVTFLGSFTPLPEQVDLSGLHFDPDIGALFSMYDSADAMVATTLLGSYLDTFDLPHDAQEGIATLGDVIVLADDAASVFRHAFTSPFGAPTDAGSADGGDAVDGGGPPDDTDAGPSDPSDSGPSDSGPSDSGPSDSGLDDAGAPHIDGGSVIDAGDGRDGGMTGPTLDAGADAGDGSDAGPDRDAGREGDGGPLPDAGPPDGADGDSGSTDAGGDVGVACSCRATRLRADAAPLDAALMVWLGSRARRRPRRREASR